MSRSLVEPILQLRDVSLSFKGIRALSNVSFDVARGEIRALIGPNGAGKSSLLNVINRIYRADKGEVIFDGVRFKGVGARGAARLGISRTFQHNALFQRLSVLDNILAGLARKARTTFIENAFRIGRDREERRRFAARAEELIAFLGLEGYVDQRVSTLPYGVQKRVDLARALGPEPKLLLLDEPMAGMNTGEKQQMARFVSDVNERFGTTIVLIEHDIGIVMDLAERIVVLDYGRTIADGPPQEVRSNPDVIAAYLGVDNEQDPGHAD